MRFDSAGLEVLTRQECLRLLVSTPIGRIVFTDRALPAVQPVGFCLDGGNVVIQTTAGSKLAAATRDAVVAFEVDDFDPRMRAGWSVTVVGRARAVQDQEEIIRLAELPLIPWAGNGRDHFVVIGTEEISGRRTSSPVS
ncbi:pyridoxamine 5'-phosphate oxidase family protein [Streptosporangium sp. NPDC023615]|uniref:pyridoxamine 5'-phosphate oxidase family protein n=1 Tax=Streptosporangium sp. NPDC023615 TaxID=3154794 RepID=UPI00341C3FED